MNLNYIKDKEIDLIKEDTLGTLPYVDTLLEVIERSETPFTIGLLGSWGSGKSSIVKTLQEHFHSDPKKQISFFIYDAWKYSKDSFRRTFILELQQFFKLDTTDEFKSFYQDKHTEIGGKLLFSRAIILYLLVAIGLISTILYWIFSRQLESQILVSLFTLTVTIILFLLKESLVQCKISVTTPKIFAPEQFEDIFDEIIEKVTLKNRPVWRWLKGIFDKQVKKIVIAIDNIDRCERQLAIELLLTIKNFLEKENVVFLLPVDEDGLKKYFGKDSSHDSNEFLRKMFNTTLKIKTFSPGELYDFASGLNTKHKLGLSATVLSLVCQEYSQNPRRVIQFLNTMQTEIFLAKKQEDKGFIAKGAVSDQLPMLAKLIIIREEWSELYETIADNSSLLKEMEEALRDKNFKFSEDGKTCILNIGKPMILSIEQYRFFDRRRDIEVNNLEPFFVTKDIFDDIPDRVRTLILNGDWEALKKLISEGELLFERLFDVIADQADLDVIKRQLMPTTGFILISLIFKIGADKEFLNKLDDIYDRESFKKIKNIIDKKDIEDLIYKFNPEELNSFAKWLNLKGWDALVNRIIQVINVFDVSEVDNRRLKTIKAFIDNFAEIPACITKIKNSFTRIITGNPHHYDYFKESLQNREIAQNLIIEDSLFTSFMQNLEQAVKKDTKKKVEVFKDLNRLDFFSQKYVNSYINHIVNFVNSQDWGLMDFWFSAAEKFIERIDDKNIIEMVNNVLNNRFQFLFSTYRGGNVGEQYLKCYGGFLKAAKEFYISADRQNNTPIQWMVNFFDSNRSPQIYLLVNKLFEDVVNRYESYNWPFAQNVINRFINIGNWDYQKEFAVTLNLMLNKTVENNGLSNEQVNSILDQYLNSVFNGKTEAKEWLLQAMKNEHIKKMIVDKFGSVAELEKQKKIVEIIVETKDEELISRIIKNILNSTVVPQLRSTVEEVSQLLGKPNPELFKDILTEFLREIKSDEIEKYKDFIELYISLPEIIGGDESLVIDKLRSPLASDDSKRQDFALNLLVKIEKIPSDKRVIIKELFQSIDENKLSEENKESIKKIKSRLK